MFLHLQVAQRHIAHQAQIAEELRQHLLQQGYDLEQDCDSSYVKDFFMKMVVPSSMRTDEDDHYFPLRVTELGTTPCAMGEDYVRDLVRFRKWAQPLQDQASGATPDTDNYVTMGVAWHKTALPHVGYLHHYFNHCNFAGCFEYWAPLGAIDNIMSARLKQTILIDRPTLIHWLLNIKRSEHGVDTDQYAFQVLCVQVGDEHLYFWRANQPKGKFLHCTDTGLYQPPEPKSASWSRGKGDNFKGGAPWKAKGNNKGNRWNEYNDRDASAGSYSSWGKTTRWDERV